MTYKQAYTQRDVARAAGVSDMTVSRVLRGSGTVSERTRDHIMQVVREMGYVPSRLPGSLAKSKSNQVGVIIPSLTSSIFNLVAAGIASELEKAGYNPVIGISEYDEEREESLIESMLSWRPAGFIVNDFVHSARTRNMLQNAGIPVVEMMELKDDPIDKCVGFNHSEAARALTEHLLTKGYRRFGFLGWTPDRYAASTRFRTIRKILHQKGLPLAELTGFTATPDEVEGKLATKALLDAHPDLDVIIYSNDSAAIGGMLHCLDAGLSIPDEIAIAGFSGIPAGQVMPKQLTTISFKRFEVGRRAAKVVLNSLVGQKEPAVVDMGFELIPGTSS